MREIKFRAKADDGKWYIGGYVDGWVIDMERCGEVTNSPFIVGTQMESYVRVDHETVGQYTGLKDKNGREIYEGDILANKKAFNRSFKVIWNPDGAWFVHDGDDWPCYYLRQVNGSTEVIGNVFEHPELLEVKEAEKK